MSSIIKQSENLVTYVKSVIFKYCPYVQDRICILENSESPEFDIEVNIRDNQTQVMFMFGNNNSICYRIYRNKWNNRFYFRRSWIYKKYKFIQ